MAIEREKAKSFYNLEVWQVGHSLVLDIYRITNRFPKNELFCLTSQIRKASVSVTSNLAEGFGRSSYKEKIYFYNISMGSVIEIQNQLLISSDLKYISKEDFLFIGEKTIKIHKMINALIKKIKINNNKTLTTNC
uniref:Four helix bundle protein n=1 Tax=candidate division CPR3 bacterium TaxID=2268181 RepID=A0A7C4M1X5_UNCC3